MRIADIKHNDITNGKGICVSLWVQGCDRHCFRCHNESTWDFNGGYEAPADISEQLIKAIGANGVERNFSVLGGEPLAPQNIDSVDKILKDIRVAYPDITIYLWTGYTLEELQAQNNDTINSILKNVDVLIDGPYIDAERDLKLPLRGSRNQRILYKGKDY